MTAFRMAALALGLFGLSAQLEAVQFPPTPMCPMVYQPAVCSYEEYSAEGSNTCFARIALKKKLTIAGVDYDPALIRCSVTQALMKRSEPACGIVPTTTSCSVTVEDQVWAQSAESCASPIPGLRQQLVEAGIEDTEGLTAVCYRSQLTGTTEFTVAL
ncbi:hypothetical protein [Oligoflexus tunisiensis]|uniref:hypothetical protein n=1 Tax=Oligoflexus tunisiensis TaxID=708132 RepID=UPI00114D2428|nr:hypothetical protein [Oligoflexus tunisiensis]